MIIGITGTFAGGKDTVADYLVEKKGYGSYGTGDVVREYVEKNGWPSNRDSQREMGNKLRKEYGSDFLVKEAIKRAPGENKVISGIRQPNEADYFIENKDTTLISIDAPVEIRHERMKARGRQGDPETVEELKEKESKEMTSDLTDKGAQNISYCMKVAEYHIDNSGSLEELYQKVEEVLRKINEKYQK